jgi:arylamine N-acetyltransferase
MQEPTSPAAMPALENTSEGWSLDDVLSRLGLARPARPNQSWLARGYHAWNHKVPFTNLDKLRAIRRGEALPSLEPRDMFAAYLERGVFGPCFAHGVGFSALLRAVGYDAQNYAGYTIGDDGVRGEHNSTVVTLDGEPWLVDTALPHGRPLQLFRDRDSEISDVMTPIIARPSGELWELDFLIRHNNERRKAPLLERIQSAEHAMRCWSRTLQEAKSSFNRHPVARLEIEGGCLTLAGNKLFVLRYETGMTVEPAGPDTLLRFGIRPEEYEFLWARD